MNEPFFGKLTVIGEPQTIDGRKRCLCRCECGAEKVIRLDHLRSGETQSCGCDRNAKTVQRSTKHGHKKRTCQSPEHRAWSAMIQRCCNPKHRGYKDYGGRGIAVCQEWRESFEAFYRDMGPRPSPCHSLDRYPNHNGNYEPGNVRWATDLQQARNTRRNRLLTLAGETLTVSEWAERVGITPSALWLRLKKGWPIERALTTSHR